MIHNLSKKPVLETFFQPNKKLFCQIVFFKLDIPRDRAFYASSKDDKVFAYLLY
jgi:hypothetical protein